MCSVPVEWSNRNAVMWTAKPVIDRFMLSLKFMFGRGELDVLSVLVLRTEEKLLRCRLGGWKSLYSLIYSYCLKILFKKLLLLLYEPPQSRWEKLGADENTLIWLAFNYYRAPQASSSKCFADFSSPGFCFWGFLQSGLSFFFWLLRLRGRLQATLKQSTSTFSAWPSGKNK